VYPRSAATFRYALVSNQETPPVEFSIRNPAPAHVSAWVGAACPQTAQSGETQFVLRNLQHSPEGGPYSPFAQATGAFEYFEHGRRANSWRPDFITVFDAGGNALETSAWDYTQHSQATFDALCRFESAWKLRVRFVRSDPPAVRPDFLVSFLDLPAPRRNKLNEPGKVVKRGKVMLRLDRLIGGGNVSWSQGSGTFTYPDVTLTANAPAGEYQMSLIKCTDQTGQKLDVEASGPGEVIVRPEQEFTYSLAPYAKATRRLNLTLALHRTRTVEFLVKPSTAQPSDR